MSTYRTTSSPGLLEGGPLELTEIELPELELTELELLADLDPGMIAWRKP
jgi:hypothetical protein